eukprot:3622383-Prymnesium_polylepis.1
MAARRALEIEELTNMELWSTTSGWHIDSPYGKGVTMIHGLELPEVDWIGTLPILKAAEISPPKVDPDYYYDSDDDPNDDIPSRFERAIARRNADVGAGTDDVGPSGSGDLPPTPAVSAPPSPPITTLT